MTIGAFKLNSISKVLSSGGGTVISATGGTISYFSTGGVAYKLHTFTTSGSFVVSTGGTADALVVGGGGAGAGGVSYIFGGGGGGGRVQKLTSTSLTPQTYTITVGTTQNTSGGTGNSSSAFGITSVGGGGGGNLDGGAGGAAGGGGGSTNASTGDVGIAGTGTQAGGVPRWNTGNFTGGAGGGGSNSAVGGTAGGAVGLSNGVGGAGGAGVAITGFAATTEYYGGGGGGGATTTGGTGGTGGGGAGKSGVGAGTAGTANTGGGGGGAYSTGSANAGGAGASGVVKIAYAFGVPVSAISYTSTAYAYSASITMPTIQQGDLAILFDSASNASLTIPTQVIPSGFTEITDVSKSMSASGASIASYVYYKILDGTESGTTITGMSATKLPKQLIIYRPTGIISSITVYSPNSQATTAVPTNQTLQLGTYNTALDIGFAVYNGTSTISTRGSTITATQELGNSVYAKIKTFEGGGFSNSTISQTDSGTNILQSFILRIS